MSCAAHPFSDAFPLYNIERDVPLQEQFRRLHYIQFADNSFYMLPRLSGNSGQPELLEELSTYVATSGNLP